MFQVHEFLKIVKYSDSFWSKISEYLYQCVSILFDILMQNSLPLTYLMKKKGKEHC